jgi:hypothetical protein
MNAEFSHNLAGGVYREEGVQAYYQGQTKLAQLYAPVPACSEAHSSVYSLSLIFLGVLNNAGRALVKT